MWPAEPVARRAVSWTAGRYVAVLLRSAQRWYRMRWQVTAHGLRLATGSDFGLPGCSDPLLPPSGSAVDGGSAPGTTAGLGADGSVTVQLGAACTVVDFRVKRARCCAGPGAGEPPAGRTGGSMTFAPTSPRAGCA